MKKRIMALLLSGLCLTACAKSTNTSATTEQTTTTETTTIEEATTTVDNSAYDDSEFLNNLVIDENTKLVAITIDDGPDGSGTKGYLKLIEQTGIRATFFVIGNKIATNGKQLKQMAELKCEIGNHSWSHDYLNTMTVNEIKDEVAKVNKAISVMVPNYISQLVRAPYFAYSNNMYSAIEAPIIDAAKAEVGEDEAATLETLLNVKDGDIVLLHSWNTASLKALETAIPTLKEQGVVFVTVSQLFQLQNVTPENGRVYRNIARGE